MTTSTPISISLLLAAAACGFPRPPSVAGPDDASSATYQLVALVPPIASTGDVIILEGTFADAATVHFPGNVSQQATMLGAHRATVVVPANATAGDLTVETGGVTLGPLTFRRASFALGLQPFRKRYEQTDVARQMPSLTTPRNGHSATATRSSLYVIGGVGATGYLSNLERATINADGTLGAFSAVIDIGLTTARAGHASVVVGTWLYVIGGANDSGTLNSIERATINADGTLGPFTTAAVTLTAGRKYAASAVVGPYVYVVGGAGSGAMDTVERAEIAADGSLGAFSIVSGVTLTTARSGHTCTTIGHFLYAAGGSSNSNATNSVERATIDENGQISTFSTAPGVALVTARTNHAATILGASFYVLGGLGSGGNLTTVEKAAIGADGSLGPFTTVSALELATARNGYTASIVQNYLYLVGGSNGGNLSSVERATIKANGHLGTFTVTTNSTLTSDRISAITVTIGRYIYEIGGYVGTRSASPLDSVERATVNPDGSLGPFSIVPGIKLVTARSATTAAVIGSYLYIVGGDGSGGSGTSDRPLATIERAEIDAEGQLGAFVPVSGVMLSTKRSAHTSAIVGNVLYVIGGADAVNPLSIVERADIGTGGSLGIFTNDNFSMLDATRSSSSVAVLGDTLYVFGGLGNGPPSSVAQATLYDDGEISAFTTSPDTTLAANRYSQSGAVVGDSFYLLGGNGGSVADEIPKTIETVPIGRLNLTGTFTAVPGIKLTTVRVDHRSLAIGNFLYNIGTFATIEQAPLL